jgi:hypothetical protein
MYSKCYHSPSQYNIKLGKVDVYKLHSKNILLLPQQRSTTSE